MIFKDQPADFKKQIDVVGCFVEHDGKFVLLQRHENDAHGGKLGLPAGKVDAGETIHEAMKREIREETGIEIPENKLEYFNSQYVRHEGFDFIFHMFSSKLTDRPEIKLSPSEHTNFSWASPGEALELELIHDLEECIKLFYKI